MYKIKEEVSLILSRNINVDSKQSRNQIATDIHETYLRWLEFHLPDLESGWTLQQCLDELGRIFKEE